jgi:hypothetical protein
MPRAVAYAAVLAAGAAGYANAPVWLVPAAAACLTLADWRPWRLVRQARAPWTSKTISYFVAGIIADLAIATLAFGAGRMARLLLG